MIFHAEKSRAERWGAPARDIASLSAKDPWAPIAYDSRTKTPSTLDNGSALPSP